MSATENQESRHQLSECRQPTIQRRGKKILLSRDLESTVITKEMRKLLRNLSNRSTNLEYGGAHQSGPMVRSHAGPNPMGCTENNRQ